MNQIEIGKFIAQCRKEVPLTQAQLAEKLNITDRAISKWETGKSMPDSSIMLELCEILGVTVNDLLNGEIIDTERFGKKAGESLITLKKKEENNMAKNRIISLLFSATLLVASMVCLICNIAIDGKLTWSLIPIGSIAFAWVIFTPSIVFGKKGVIASLISLSIFTVPYLLLLSSLLKVKAVFSVGSTMAMISILFLWMIVTVMKRIGKTQKLVALGITFLLAIPFVLIVNAVLSKMIATPFLDVWDVLSIFILLVLAFVAFICSYANMQRK